MKTIVDCFGYNKIYIPQTISSSENVITSTISPGYENLLDDLLFSLFINSSLQSFRKLIFMINPNSSCYDVVKKWECEYIICESIKPVAINSKSVLYSLDQVFDFKRMIYLDSDFLILNNIDDLFTMLDHIPENNIMICRDFYFDYAKSLKEIITNKLYEGKESDFEYLLGEVNNELSFPFIVNAGMMACNKSALIQARNTMSSFHNIVEWINSGVIREQFAFNLSLAKNHNYTILHPKYNYQMCTESMFYINIDEFGNIISKNYFEPFSNGYIKNVVDFYNYLSTSDSLFREYSVKYNRIPTQDVIMNYLNIKFEDIVSFENINNNVLQQNKDIKYNLETKYVDYLISSKDKMPQNASICCLHCNGPKKNLKNIRDVIMNILKQKETLKQDSYINSEIKFAINTHKDYSSITLPLLIESLLNNNIVKSNIVIFSAGWDNFEDSEYDGIKLYKCNYNSFEHTSLITIIEHNISGSYWFNLHDTVKVGPTFYKKILAKKKYFEKYEYASVAVNNALNMGIFRRDFLFKIKNYLLSLKDCSKSRAIISEHFYSQFGTCYRLCNNYEKTLGVEDIYNTGTQRIIRYFEDIDLYKYQANKNIHTNILKA